jgi:hypothetical protein
MIDEDTPADEVWSLSYDVSGRETLFTWKWWELTTPTTNTSAHVARFGERWFLFYNDGDGGETNVIEVASFDAAKLALEVIR